MNGTERPLSRRRFLSGGLLVLGLAVLPPGIARVLRASTPADGSLLAAERLVEIFRDPSEVEPLGEVYLAQRSDRPGHGQLMAELLPAQMTEDTVLGSTVEELRAAIRDWSAADLAAGRLLDVDGWLMSATEVRLAGLVVALGTTRAGW